MELAAGVDAILTNWKRVPEEALDAARQCLVVARYGVGVDNIPVARATELGMLVVNVPDFCVEEVSDHALALLLACARRIVTFAALHAHRRRWDLLGLGRGLPRLRGQRLGHRRLRQHRAHAHPEGAGPRARGASSPRRGSPPAATARPPSRRRTTSITSSRVSDYVSLHAPATRRDARG